MGGDRGRSAREDRPHVPRQCRVVARLRREPELGVRIGREAPQVDAGPGQDAETAERSLLEPEHRTGPHAGVRYEGNPPARVVALGHPGDAERAGDPRSGGVMREGVECERVEEQIERRPLERLAPGAHTRVRPLDGRGALPLGLGPEAQAAHDTLVWYLHAAIAQLAL